MRWRRLPSRWRQGPNWRSWRPTWRRRSYWWALAQPPWWPNRPPPGAVSGKLAALGRVEAFDGLDKAHVAFTDQVQQWQADAFVVAGDFDHQAQVGLDHLLPRLFVSPLDPGGQFNLLLRCQ